jgi:hypothetical protein
MRPSNERLTTPPGSCPKNLENESGSRQRRRFAHTLYRGWQKLQPSALVAFRMLPPVQPEKYRRFEIKVHLGSQYATSIRDLNTRPQYATFRAATANRCTPDWTGGAILPG